MRGQWFDFPTAATFALECAARECAEAFARAQGASGVYGACIDVRARKGGGREGRIVAAYRSEDYLRAEVAS